MTSYHEKYKEGSIVWLLDPRGEYTSGQNSEDVKRLLSEKFKIISTRVFAPDDETLQDLFAVQSLAEPKLEILWNCEDMLAVDEESQTLLEEAQSVCEWFQDNWSSILRLFSNRVVKEVATKLNIRIVDPLGRVSALKRRLAKEYSGVGVTPVMAPSREDVPTLLIRKFLEIESLCTPGIKTEDVVLVPIVDSSNNEFCLIANRVVGKVLNLRRTFDKHKDLYQSSKELEKNFVVDPESVVELVENALDRAGVFPIVHLENYDEEGGFVLKLEFAKDIFGNLRSI